MKTTSQDGLLDEIRLAQVVLITSTSRLLDVADDVRRNRDNLLELLDQTRRDEQNGREVVSCK